MSGRRRPRRRRSQGLGWVPEAHTRQARWEARKFREDVVMIRSFLAAGECRNALERLLILEWRAAQMQAHHSGSTTMSMPNFDQKMNRLGSQTLAVGRTITKLRDRLEAKCFCKR